MCADGEALDPIGDVGAVIISSCEEAEDLHNQLSFLAWPGLWGSASRCESWRLKLDAFFSTRCCWALVLPASGLPLSSCRVCSFLSTPSPPPSCRPNFLEITSSFSLPLESMEGGSSFDGCLTTHFFPDLTLSGAAGRSLCRAFTAPRPPPFPPPFLRKLAGDAV